VSAPFLKDSKLSVCVCGVCVCVCVAADEASWTDVRPICRMSYIQCRCVCCVFKSVGQKQDADLKCRNKKAVAAILAAIGEVRNVVSKGTNRGQAGVINGARESMKVASAAGLSVPILLHHHSILFNK
jgi:hypothetical protein